MSQIEIKHKRYREEPGNKPGRVRKVMQIFVVPGRHPVTGETLRCSAGPGLRHIPESGKWYDFSEYLWRRMQDGGCVNVAPPKAEKPKVEKPKSDAVSQRRVPKPQDE